MKYKLIHIDTNLETICDKVTIGEFDYYVTDELRIGLIIHNNKIYNCTVLNDFYCIVYKKDKYAGIFNLKDCSSIIATNSLQYSIPKIEEESMIESWEYFNSNEKITIVDAGVHFSKGFFKSKELYPYSKEDMLKFGEWCENLQKDNKEIRRNTPSITYKELLDIWQQERIITIYYK